MRLQPRINSPTYSAFYGQKHYLRIRVSYDLGNLNKGAGDTRLVAIPSGLTSKLGLLGRAAYVILLFFNFSTVILLANRPCVLLRRSPGKIRKHGTQRIIHRTSFNHYFGPRMLGERGDGTWCSGCLDVGLIKGQGKSWRAW
jgi:hypothetical protein